MASTARFAIPAERPLLGRLREQLRAAEAATGLTDDARLLSLDVPAIDHILGGGLSCGALHEIAAARESEIASATGFALGLASCGSHIASASGPDSPMVRDVAFRAVPHHEAEQSALILRSRAMADAAGVHAAAGRGVSKDEGAGSVIWIAEELSLAESGAPYGPGLDAASVAPERLITVVAARAHDVLWAMEEALRCRAVGVVIGELRARAIDHVASRRLAIAAAAGNTLGLLLRPAPDDDASAAATRWIVGVAPSRRNEERRGVGPPRLAVRLVRNRRGHLGTWIVEWDSVEQRFVLPTHSEPVARTAADRSHQTAVA